MTVGYFLQLSRNTTVVGSILTTPHAAHSPRRPYQHLITPPPPQLPGAEADEAAATSCCRSQNLFNQKAWPNHSGPATSEKPLSLLPCFHSSSKTYQKIKKPKDSGGAQAQWCPLLSSATRVLSWEVQQWGPRFLELGYVLEAAWLRLVPRDLSQAGSPLSWLLLSIPKTDCLPIYHLALCGSAKGLSFVGLTSTWATELSSPCLHDVLHTSTVSNRRSKNPILTAWPVTP